MFGCSKDGTQNVADQSSGHVSPPCTIVAIRISTEPVETKDGTGGRADSSAAQLGDATGAAHSGEHDAREDRGSTAGHANGNGGCRAREDAAGHDS